MAAWGMLGGKGTAQGGGQNNLLQLLQLGNEIGSEQGHGRDDQVMQLIAALLGQQR